MVGLYSAEFVEDGRESRFRTWVWAEAPDRLHIEVLSGIGTTVLILDAGGGRMAIAVPREKRAWAGAASSEALRRFSGFQVELEALVQMVLVGNPVPGVEIKREGSAAGTLPRRLELAAAARVLRLDLRRLRPLGSRATGSLGTGNAPAGYLAEPIEEFLIEDWSLPQSPAIGRTPG